MLAEFHWLSWRRKDAKGRKFPLSLLECFIPLNTDLDKSLKHSTLRKGPLEGPCTVRRYTRSSSAALGFQLGEDL